MERQFERLREWEEYRQRYSQRLTRELIPLQEQLRVARGEMAQLVEQILTVPVRGRRLGKVQRAKLNQLKTRLTESLRNEEASERAQHATLLREIRTYAAIDPGAQVTSDLQLEEADSLQPGSLTPQRIALLTQTLRRQLAHLQVELERTRHPFLMAMGRSRNSNLTPDEVDRALSNDIAQMQAVLQVLQEDLVAFRTPDGLRTRLAKYELEENDG